MRLKWILLAVPTVLLSAGLAFYLFVDGLSQHRPDVIELSKTRQYIVERVPLSVPFSGENLAYLRVSDQDEPSKIYRSPLYPVRQLEMKSSARPGMIGLATVDFNTTEKSFVFYGRGWKEHWLNRFVSNTAYRTESDFRRAKP